MSKIKKELFQLWKELQEKREVVLFEGARDSTRMQIKKQVCVLMANEYTDIMDALNKIISEA